MRGTETAGTWTRPRSPDAPTGLSEPTDEMWREVPAQLRVFVRRRIADPQRADDLVGDILVRIHQNMHSVHDRELLMHWVSQVSRR